VLRFLEFIKEEKSIMQKLTARELLKYDWRVELFLRKYKDNEPFEMANGSKVTFIFNKKNEVILKERNQTELNKLRFFDSKGNEYRLGDVGKSREFGGKGSGFGTVKEDRELQSLINQIETIKSQIASATVPIKIGNKIHQVYTAASTPGTPKSDFHLLDLDGKEIVWISHKDGRTQKDFQQWGGISQRAEPKIFAHPEVKTFLSDLKKLWENGIPRATSVYRKIKDEKLKMMSVYGNEYKSPGTNLGRQNVSIMLQGPVKLKKTTNHWVFKSNHVHLNGESMAGPYEPVLTAIYKGDRSDGGIKGARIVIMPIEGRRMTGIV
jgi:hypothetical protein